MAFEQVRYANCWEDADILCEGLRPSPGKRVLSIASAGDNALALLADGAEVVAADLSLAQLSCLELRCAAFRHLSYEGVLRFLGAQPALDRLATLEQLQGDLSPSAREFWKQHQTDVQNGVIHAGKMERYFHLFRRRILPLIHRASTVRSLLEPRGPDARTDFYSKVWNTWRWRVLFRIFFSRRVMGRLGRDPEFFRYVEGSVSDRILERARYGLTALPTHDNPFLRYIVTGTFGTALPRYLQPDKFEAIRDGLSRLTLFHGPIEEAARTHADGGFDAFNLSDIFEYLSPGQSAYIYEKLVNVARGGARLAYWNTLVPRRCPTELSGRVRPLDDLSHSLLARDRAFFYTAFWLDEVS